MRFGKPDRNPRARKLHPPQEEEARPSAPGEGEISEGDVAWDAAEGHNHDGTVSRAVDHESLTNVSENQHHDRVHPLVGPDHTAGGLTTGHVLTATGTSSFDFEAPVPVPHALLSTTHSDATAASCSQGALVTGQGSPATWSKLALGTAGRVLKSVSGDAAWGQVALSEVTGSISAAQHGTQASTAGSTADHTGTLSANARLQAQYNGAVVGSPRPTFDFVPGTNVTLSVTDTGAKISVTINAAGGGAAHNLWDSAHHSDVTGTPATGDVVYRNGSSQWARLPVGSTNQVLKVNSGVPAWGAVSSGEVAFSGLTAGQVWRASGASAAAFAPLQHADVTFSGLTAGQVWRASGAAAAAFAPLLHTDVTFSGLTAGRVWRASSATAASFAQLSHGDLDPSTVTENQHHNKQHNLWDSAHHGDVTGTPAAGDVIYRNRSSQWARLAKGSDEQILKLVSGLPAWSNVSSVATTRALIQGWKRNDIRNAGTSDTEMNGFDGLNTGECMAYSGTLVGIAVTLERDIDNGGAAPSASYTLTAYKSSNQGVSWSSMPVSVTLSAGVGTERRAYATGFSASFAAGDLLTIQDRKVSLPGVANGCKANLIVVFD